VGPPLLGLLADRTSFGTALVANALLVGLATLIFAVLARETAGRAGRDRQLASAAQSLERSEL